MELDFFLRGGSSVVWFLSFFQVPFLFNLGKIKVQKITVFASDNVSQEHLNELNTFYVI